MIERSELTLGDKPEMTRPPVGGRRILVVPPGGCYRDLADAVERISIENGVRLVRVATEIDVATACNTDLEATILVFEDAYLALNLDWDCAVFALPSPDDALSGAVWRFGIEPNSAISWVARWRCSALELRQGRRDANILILRPQNATYTPMEAVARHFGLQAPKSVLEDMSVPLRDWVSHWSANTREPASQVLDLNAPDRVKAVLPILSAYDLDLYHRDIEFDWPYSVFYCPDFEADLPRPTIDLTGRVRALYYGPYLYLPPGEWRVSARVSLAGLTSATHFRLEIDTGGAQVYSDVSLIADGRYDIYFNLEIDRTQVVDFRLWLLRPCFSGLLTFHRLYVQRVIDIPPES